MKQPTCPIANCSPTSMKHFHKDINERFQFQPRDIGDDVVNYNNVLTHPQWQNYGRKEKLLWWELRLKRGWTD